MLVLNPRQVTFGASRWETVGAIAIDRSPQRTVEEWSDLGPYAVLADVPEQRTRIQVVQELTEGDVNLPRPGEQATLTFYTSPTPGAARRKVSATAVVLEVRHELSLRKGAIRTVTLAAISSGSADPISITDAPDQEP